MKVYRINNNIDVLSILPGSKDTEFKEMNTKYKFNLRSTENIVNSTLHVLGRKHVKIDGWVNYLFFTLTKFFN